MRGFVAPTDFGWYQFLRARPYLEEVNFWRPGGAPRFQVLQPGEPFFFKLKAPHSAIGGFGLFARFARMPLWWVWDAFGESNGVDSDLELRARLERLTTGPRVLTGDDRPIGCVSISQPVFFAPDEWVETPSDWKSNIVSGRGYDLTVGEGRRLWEKCLERALAMGPTPEWVAQAEDDVRTGQPHLVHPRLGQAGFRIAVLQAYGNACAVTTEHSLPVLEAAHIRPFAVGGSHEVSNGLPLRRDLHRLFDLGFMTIKPDLQLAVSRRLREDWANGVVYYALEGTRINVPADPSEQPSSELLEWHRDMVFKG